MSIYTINGWVALSRRRVGKSRLINFFASSCSENKLWDFSGLAPQEGMNDQSQRDHFERQLATHLKLPPFTFQDWTDAFEHLSSHIKNLFVCEFKFKRRELGADVISEVQDKVTALKVPRGFAVIPVLFHIGGVSSHVATRDYFYRTIDISDFLRAED